METSQSSVQPVPSPDVAKPKFYIGEVINSAWQKLIQNIWYFVGIAIVYTLINLSPEILSFLVEGLSDRVKVGGIYIGLVSVMLFVFFVLQIITSLGIINIALLSVDNKETRFSSLFNVMPVFLNYIAGSILYVIIIWVGLILFIIPGIIWQIKFGLFPYYILEGAGPIEALKKSGQVTYGSKWRIFALILVLILINIVGAILFFVGLVITIPLSILTMASVYRKLQPLASNQIIS
jgi:uncharacterized membrane protein